jgi:putative transposase
MARRPRLLAPGVVYHVIVRGNQRQKTFLSERDYQAYLARLGRYRKRLGFTVYAGGSGHETCEGKRRD